MTDPNKNAVLYRIATGEHTCALGLKAAHLLRQEGYCVEERPLTTRAEIDAFQFRHGVDSTPQAFIAGQRIGGYDDLKAFFRRQDAGGVSYAPLFCVFLTAAIVATGASWSALGTPLTLFAAEWFGGIAIMLLAMLKLIDLESFSTLFLGYDLAAQRWIPYASACPILAWSAGALIVANALPLAAVVLSIAIGTIGGISILLALARKQPLRCACVGGIGNMPLGASSLLESVLLIGMGIETLVQFG